MGVRVNFSRATRRVDSWQAHGHVIAEPVDRVVRAGGGDRFNPQVCPLRKLRSKQAPHERYVGVHLVGMHAGSGHELSFPPAHFYGHEDGLAKKSRNTT
jgi:hypothetical protein